MAGVMRCVLAGLSVYALCIVWAARRGGRW